MKPEDEEAEDENNDATGMDLGDQSNTMVPESLSAPPRPDASHSHPSSGKAQLKVKPSPAQKAPKVRRG